MRARLVRLAAIAAVAGGTVGAVAVPASATTATVVYACGMSGFWTCPTVRPGEIAFGALYDVARLSWSSWRYGSAYGHGHYDGFGSYNASVTLSGVAEHDGRRYFSWIKIAAGGHRTRYLHYTGVWAAP